MRAEILPSQIGILKEEYKILVLPDLHIPIDMELKEIILNSDIFKSIDYIILLGDNVACYGNDREYEILNEFIKKMGKPYTAINGNHEFMFEVVEYDDKNYGRMWKANDKNKRGIQLERFYNFFNLKEKYWYEKVDEILYIFLTIGKAESEKIEILPENCEKFLEEIFEKLDNLKYIFIFCHAPLKGSEIPTFKYYTDQGDPFIYLSENLIKKIEKLKIPIYWFSGHIHLNYNHPMSLIRKLNKNLYQVNCPPTWRFSRRDLNDIIPKRYNEFSSLIIEKNKKIKLKIFEWIKNEFIKEFKI
ncbi:MAG: metallophosphatase family protein [Candidatus Omnitrophica bacterium]|nr:metallophosphatase family protein [Candidatus Omnitrophota bacterium]